MNTEQNMKESLERLIELTRKYVTRVREIDGYNGLDMEEHEMSIMAECQYGEQLLANKEIVHTPPDGFTHEHIIDYNVDTSNGNIKYDFADWDYNTDSITIPYQLISKNEAYELLGDNYYGGLNYELEQDLDRFVGLGFIINEECRKETGKYYQL